MPVRRAPGGSRLRPVRPSPPGIRRGPGASGLLRFRQAADGSHREPVARSMEAPPRLQQRMRHSGQRGAKRQHDQGGLEIAHSDPQWRAGQYRPRLRPRMKGEGSSTPKRTAGAGPHVPVSEPLQNRGHPVRSPEAARDSPAPGGARTGRSEPGLQDARLFWRAAARLLAADCATSPPEPDVTRR